MKASTMTEARRLERQYRKHELALKLALTAESLTTAMDRSRQFEDEIKERNAETARLRSALNEEQCRLRVCSAELERLQETVDRRDNEIAKLEDELLVLQGRYRMVRSDQASLGMLYSGALLDVASRDGAHVKAAQHVDYSRRANGKPFDATLQRLKDDNYGPMGDPEDDL